MKKIMLLTVCVLFSTSCEKKIKEREMLLTEQTNTFNFPKRIGLINDFEGVFNENQEEELRNILVDFANNNTKEIIIVSLENSKYSDFQKLTMDLANEWKIGNQNEQAILIVFSKKSRKLGLSIVPEKQNINDDEIRKIISELVMPEFKRNKFYEGLKSGVENIISIWD